MIIAQIIGFIGLAFIVGSWQSKKRPLLLTLLLTGHLLFAAHYTLLAAWTGVGMNIVGAARAYVYHQRHHKWAQHTYWISVFILLFCVAGFFGWEGVRSLLPVAGMTLECVVLWSKSTKTIRLGILASIPLWFIYNYLVQSFAGMLTGILVLISVSVGIYRYDVKHKV